MLLWFLGASATIVWSVFRDERFDYRALFLGVLVVDAVDALTGGAWVMHSVLTSVAVLTMVMVATRRGSAARRSMLGIPIGMFLHLVVDGAFSAPSVFWWPSQAVASWFSSEPGGWFSAFDGVGLPSVERGTWNIPLEIAGALLLLRLWRIHGLADPAARARFVRTGRLVPVAPADGPTGGGGPVGTC